MGVKYVKDFSFPSSGGFHGDVQRYAKGGHVTKVPSKAKSSYKDVPARAKPNAPAKGAPKMESKPKMGKGQGYEKGGYVPGKEKDVLPTKSPPGMGKDLAPARRFKGKYEGYAEGGEIGIARDPNYEERMEEQRLLGSGPPMNPPEMNEQGRIIYRGGFEGRGEDRGGRGEVISPSPLAQMGNELPFDRTKYNNWYEDPRYLPEDPLEQPDRYISLGDRIIPSIPGNIGPEFPLMTTMPVPNRPRLRSEVVGRSPLAQAARRRAMMAREDMARGPRDGIMRRRTMREVPDQSLITPPIMGDYNGPTYKPGDIVYDALGQPGYVNFPVSPENRLKRGQPIPPGGYAKGGAVKGKSKIAKVMGEYKRGELHSGSKKGPKVKSREQAVAIALSEARKAGAKIPKKAEGGEIYSTEYLAYGDKKGPYRGSPKKAKMLGRQDRRAREAMERAEKYAPGMSLDMPGKVVKKAKGGGFPDLTGDGKVTRADVLKGRGVFKKGGMAKHKDVKMDKAMMRKAVHKHEKAMHPGKKLTKLSDGGVPSYGRKPMYGGGKC